MGGSGSWPLAQPQSDVQPPLLHLPLAVADSPAMTFSALLPESLFIFPFSSSPLLGGDLLGSYLPGPLKAPMLLCESFRTVGSFRTGQGSESTDSRIPHPKPQLVARSFPTMEESLDSGRLGFSP